MTYLSLVSFPPLVEGALSGFDVGWVETDPDNIAKGYLLTDHLNESMYGCSKCGRNSPGGYRWKASPEDQERLGRDDVRCGHLVCSNEVACKGRQDP